MFPPSFPVSSCTPARPYPHFANPQGFPSVNDPFFTVSTRKEGCRRRIAARLDLTGGASSRGSAPCSAACTNSPHTPCCRARLASTSRTASNFAPHCCCLLGVLAVHSFVLIHHGRGGCNAACIVHVALSGPYVPRRVAFVRVPVLPKAPNLHATILSIRSLRPALTVRHVSAPCACVAPYSAFQDPRHSISDRVRHSSRARVASASRHSPYCALRLLPCLSHHAVLFGVAWHHMYA